jgi:hypothetical protein
MNIYIGNLPLATSSDDLRMLFAEFGRVQTATVVFDRITHRSKRFGFVKMPIRAEADQAMNSLDNKGKAHKRYEFGCKVSVAATSKGGWFLSAMAKHGNPYDGHTLSDTLQQVERITKKPEHAFVDMGYRGHGYEGEIHVHVDKRKRGRTAKSMWRWMKPRAAIEPGIGHLKREHRMDRNRLKGIEGDCFNTD